ncbi:MAG: MFS transporter [Myxococcales bacterium]|nr:MAG: MFS transporter [Myxococcales bacterium]
MAPGSRPPLREDQRTPLDSPPLTRRNWWLHVLEGTTLIGAGAAINPNTVGSALVESLGGAAWMVALMPMATHVGFSLGPILSAHHLDRRSEFIPVLRAMLPLSRLPLLLTAAVLWFSGAGPLALWAVVGGALAYGVAGGLSIGAWQQLIAKTVPPSERPSLFASRYLFSNVLGLGAGALVAVVLTRCPGTQGYALLYCVAFAGATLAYHLITRVSEPASPPPPPTPPRSLLQNLGDVPTLFGGDRRLSLYLLTAVLVNSQFIFIGFLAIHAQRTLNAPEGYIGALTTAQMAGAVAGTFLAARWGRRVGSRSLLLGSRALFLVVAVGGLLAQSDYAFRALFALYGAALWSNLVGHNTVTLELLPNQRRATMLATFGLVQVPSMLIASQLGALLWRGGGFTWVAVVSSLGLLAANATAWRLPRALAIAEPLPLASPRPAITEPAPAE